MSIDVNWNALGPAEHARLSNNIRDFFHQQFQRIPLPSYIANVSVLAFDLGSSAPELEIKHIGDPYPEFYEDENEEQQQQQHQGGAQDDSQNHTPAPSYSAGLASSSTSNFNSYNNSYGPSLRFRNPGFTNTSTNTQSNSVSEPSSSTSYNNTNTNDSNNASHSSSSSSINNNVPFLHSMLTPPLIRSPPIQSSFHHFPGISVAAAAALLSPTFEPLPRNAEDDDMWNNAQIETMGHNAPSSLSSEDEGDLSAENAIVDGDDEDDDFGGDLNRSRDPRQRSTPDSFARSNTADNHGQSHNNTNGSSNNRGSTSGDPPPFSVREEDLQFLIHVLYKGDMRIVLTATLRLNYPAPGFLTLPVRLTVTGFEVDAMAVLTYISRRIHFSFISDVGGNGGTGSVSEGMMSTPSARHFEVLRNIKVESEIGDQDGKGSVLKNVGKVERFVLDRLRAIVRDELAWPGWITFEF
ncbi:hypothetical protein BZA70DRAFT_278700 [Myxozyma melibiosi]|uniref:Mitochondrial distribution and morphology protein 12 n=1 Tax=Myxozyma melibiosi TaxID=54550 RepID=A0ABR1F533_9ASCO